MLGGVCTCQGGWGLCFLSDDQSKAIFRIRQKDDIREVLRESTVSVNGLNQKGRIMSDTVERESVPPQRRARCRVKNTLRYHATALYYLFRSHNFHPREVQVMKYGIGNDAQYFFATNNNDARQIQEEYRLL